MPIENRPYRFNNNITLTLAVGCSDSQTSIEVDDDDVLPELEVGEICTIVLRDDANSKYEVMNVTAHGGNTLEVERGAEGTFAYEWDAGQVIQHALTAMFFTKLTALPAEFFRTSKPYPYVFIEALDLAGRPTQGGPVIAMQDEALDFACVPSEGDIRDALIRYLNYQPEALDFACEPLEGEIRDALIRYQNYQVEALDLGCVPTGGSLT